MRLDVLAVVYRLVDRYGEDLVLNFSEYLYRPRSLFDERAEFSCAAGEVTEEWIKQKLLGLSPGWDLALNSLVRTRQGKLLHMPMVDFACENFAPIQTIKVKELVGRDLLKK